jgi:hypothetical protein
MSADRAEDIRITDLAEPVLTPMQTAAIEHVSKSEVVLDEDTVLAAASEKVGLDDFGPDDFRERLRIWLQSAEEDRDLGPIGRLSFYNDCVRYAANRLRFEDLLRRHPEIEAVEIERPIIIAGLPRSGTTHLLNLIAADERLRSLPYWESVEPIPDPAEAPGAQSVDPRLVRCRAAHEIQSRMMPLMKNMHDMAPEHVHEEIEVQALDFSSYVPEWTATVPRWRDYYLAHDQTPHYGYMKRVLQALQWLRGPERWVLKSPQHLEQLVPLQAVFPDATVVMTHRDPVSVIASAITMLCYGDRLRRRRVDPPAVATYWVDRIEVLLRRCVRDRDLIPAERSLDLPFHDFMADDVGAVERIYELADFEMTPAARASLDAFMQANPRGKHGRIVYDLAADFGIDGAALRERFSFYFDRFPVKVE